MRSLVETSKAAFVGAVEQAVPSFTGPEGMCPQLDGYLGGEESFGEGGGGEGRWLHLLEHGGRLGTEFRDAWGNMRLEALESAQWLDGELEDGPLAEPAGSAGLGSVTGGTRKAAMEQLEQLRHLVLRKALAEHRDQGARPCWSWLDRDKQTTAWLLTLTGITGAEFTEAAATLLCLPSPACSSRIGDTVRGNAKVDLFGDSVRSDTGLTGDGFRKRHDLVKNFLQRQLNFSGIQAECEVFNLFAREIPQEGLSRIEKGRARQTMVPDFKIMIPTQEGRTEPKLYEMKVIFSCPTRYPCNPRPEGKAVDRRAQLLPGEYTKKARNADTKYGGASGGETGRMERKLQSFGRVRGLVVGAWGEISEDFKELLKIMAEARGQVLQTGVIGQRQGRTDKAQLATFVSQQRQQLSRMCVVAQSRHVLDRLEGLGAGAGEAAKRRGRAAGMEHMWEKERRAAVIAARQGWRVHRTGEFRL